MRHRLCTMAGNKMLRLHDLKPYPHQLISSSHLLLVDPHQLFGSSSNRSRFVAANSTMASNEMMLVTAEQPFKGSLSVLTMSDDNIFKQATQIVDDVLLVTTHEEYQLEEKASTVKFSPLWCVIKQLFSGELSLLAQKFNILLRLGKMQTVLCRRKIEEDVEAAYWEVEYPNAFGRMIRLWGMNAFASTNPDKKPQIPANSRKMARSYHIYTAPGTWPKKPKYTLFYGGPDEEWTKQFNQRATRVASSLNGSIEPFQVGNKNKIEAKERLLKLKNIKPEEVDNFLSSFKTDTRGWVVLSDENEVLVSNHGGKMLAVLERFDGGKTKDEFTFRRSFESIQSN